MSVDSPVLQLVSAPRLTDLIRAKSFPKALALAKAQSDSESHSDQLTTVLCAWADWSPSSLADYALTLPATNATRATALTTALNRWILNDPIKASAWIVHLSDACEFDQAAALLVERTDTLHRSTATALDWADNLADPALRLHALTHVLREWAEHDPAAALNFAQTSASVTSEQRPLLLTALHHAPLTELHPQNAL